MHIISASGGCFGLPNHNCTGRSLAACWSPLSPPGPVQGVSCESHWGVRSRFAGSLCFSSAYCNLSVCLVLACALSQAVGCVRVWGTHNLGISLGPKPDHVCLLLFPRCVGELLGWLAGSAPLLCCGVAPGAGGGVVLFPPPRLWLQSVAARWLLRGAAAALRGVRINARVGHLLLYKWLWKHKPKQSDSASPTAKPPAVSNERCRPVTDLSSLT